MQLVQDDSYQTQIKAMAAFLVIFRAHVNILLIIKVKVLMLSEWSY